MRATLDLRQSLLDLAVAHRDTIFAVHTHTQRAQPTTVAHYLLAVVEQLERDTTRLKAAYENTNQNPLGACAITGTGFDIDRTLTSDLLGFGGPTRNTYGSIATVDYLLEATSAASVLLVGLGRFVQDLLLWSTSEFDYVRLGDGFVQCSSIMPQKRNPVALEHARAIGSKALGQAQAIVISVHNTPFGDIVDTEDDLQPLVFSMFRDATRVVKLVAAAMRTAEFDAERLEARAGDGWTTLTELADTLVRDHDLPFKTAHAIASRLVAARRRSPEQSLSALLAEATSGVLRIAAPLHRSRFGDNSEPAPLCERAGRPMADRRRKRPLEPPKRLARSSERRPDLVERQDDRTDRRRTASRRRAPRPCDSDRARRSRTRHADDRHVHRRRRPRSDDHCALVPARADVLVSSIDWAIVVAYLLWIVIDGLRRSKNTTKSKGISSANRSLPWWAVGLSVMATQISAITLVGTTGQAYATGLRFVQFYFGLPIAMIILSLTVVPFFTARASTPPTNTSSAASMCASERRRVFSFSSAGRFRSASRSRRRPS